MLTILTALRQEQKKEWGRGNYAHSDIVIQMVYNISHVALNVLIYVSVVMRLTPKTYVFHCDIFHCHYFLVRITDFEEEKYHYIRNVENEFIETN